LPILEEVVSVMPRPSKWAQKLADSLVKYGESKGLTAVKEQRVGSGRSCRIDVVWWAPIPSLLLDYELEKIPLVTFEIQYSKSIPSISHGVLKSMDVHPALHTIISFYPLSEKYKEMLRTIHPSGLQIFDGDRAVRLFREIVQLSFWEELSTRYDEIIRMPHQPLKQMRSYEEFETLQIDQIMERFLGRANKFSYVELGFGSGRGLTRYALKINKRGDRRLLTYDSRYDRFLQFIIGMESSPWLIKHCMQRFSEYGIDDLVGNRIFLIRAFPTQTILNVNNLPDLANPIVCCRLNVLGNLLTNNMRMQMLQNVRCLIDSGGVAVISVFDRDRLQRDGIPYIRSLASILKRVQVDLPAGNVQTESFQSHWFTREEISHLLKECGFGVVEVIKGPFVGTIVVAKAK